MKTPEHTQGNPGDKRNTQQEAELAQATITQEGMMQDLRTVGVIGLIEQATDAPIEGRKERKTPDIWPSLPKWYLSRLIKPAQTQDGKFDPTISVYLERDIVLGPIEKGKAHVNIIYYPHGHLLIRGAYTTYQGILTLENAPIITDGLSRALKSPGIEKFPTRRMVID